MSTLQKVLYHCTAVIGWMVAVLASSSGHKTEEDDGDLPGLFNYRTGKFDNGTDPYGWYDEDL